MDGGRVARNKAKLPVFSLPNRRTGLLNPGDRFAPDSLHHRPFVANPGLRRRAAQTPRIRRVEPERRCHMNLGG